MKRQMFLHELLKTYPTKRIANRLLKRESIIIINAEIAPLTSLRVLLENIKKLDFDPLLVLKSEDLQDKRSSIKQSLVNAENMAGKIDLPVFHQGLFKSGVVPCIKATDTGWEQDKIEDVVFKLVKGQKVNKIYRFGDLKVSHSKKHIFEPSHDKLLDILLKDQSFKTTILDLQASNVNDIFTHCTNGKFSNGIEYRRGIQVEKNNYDLLMLKSLLESSFNRNFRNWESYAHLLCNSDVFIAGNYFGTAVVFNILPNISYLDKFAVDIHQQSTGIAELLWSHLKSNYPTLAWRSRVDNPANSWYLSRSDGSLSLNKDWKLFWFGDGINPLMIDSLQNAIESIEPTFDSNFSK